MKAEARHPQDLQRESQKAQAVMPSLGIVVAQGEEHDLIEGVL